MHCWSLSLLLLSLESYDHGLMCNGFVVQDQQQLYTIALRMAREEEENSASKMRNTIQHAGELKGKVTLLKKEKKALRGELEVGFFLLPH